MNEFSVKYQNNVLAIDFPNVKKGWEQWMLWSSDRHHDNILCRQDLELKHLKQAQERDALIFDNGDLFCAMQGKYDPRSNMDALRPEDKREDYLDAISEHAIDFYKPFAANFALIGEGNHERSIEKRHGVNLIKRLVDGLNKNGGNVFQGNYGGWVRLQFTIHGTNMTSRNIKYYHGKHASNAPVTRGVIDTARLAVYLPDADFVFTGHSHDTWYVPIRRERVSQAGVIHFDYVHFLRTTTYKDEYQLGEKGFAVEQGKPPKPLGAAWLRFYYEDNTIRCDPMLAVL